MTGPDLLESGSARPSPRLTRGRIAGFALVLAVAGAAIGLAARANDPAPTPRALPVVPTVQPTQPPVPPRKAPYFLYDTAVASGRVYALAGSCPGRCGYQLITWDGDQATATSIAIPRTAASPGRLLVTGRYVSVLDGSTPGAWVSGDGGRTFAKRSGATGPAVDALPGGLVAEAGPGGVGGFDPAAGLWRPLAHQPAAEVLAVARSGPNLYAASRSGTALVVARSADGGRSWRPSTVTRVPYKTPELQLVPGPAGSAYLVVTRPLPAGEPGVASVWRGSADWSRVIDYTDAGGSTPQYASAVGADDGGLLLSDGYAGGELVYDTGRTVSFYAPAGLPGDPPLIPTVLRRGATSTTAGITADGWHLVVRNDHSVSWAVVPLP